MFKHLAHLVPQAILKNVRVYPVSTLPHGVFHISANTRLGRLTPMIPTRTLRTEDATFPRVCVSSSLIGCIYGHSGTLADFENNKLPGRDWLGGYYIYQVPFTTALRPNRSLLSDVDLSDEYWLYNGGHTCPYDPVKVGECFISSIDLTKLTVGKAKQKMISKTPRFYMHLERDGFPVWLDGGGTILVKAGYYRMDLLDYNLKRGVSAMRDVDIERVTYEEYMQAKGVSLVLLSHDETRSYDW